jgi:hypothetical protein
MQHFEDRKDLEEWLETLDYDAFWKAADPFGMDEDYRASCDASITKGVDQSMILKCIKSELRLKIVKEQNLKPRYYHAPPILH